MSDTEDFLRKVLGKGQEMRKLQREFFKTRDTRVLVRSKAAEGEFDKLCAEALDQISKGSDDLFERTQAGAQ